MQNNLDIITLKTQFRLLIVISIIGPTVPIVPLMLLGVILGLPAILILLTSKRIMYVYWLLIYLSALPIWNFILPVYAFWHFDDFSWGQTRQVEGEIIDRNGHGNNDNRKIGAAAIPMKRWVDWERERRNDIITEWIKLKRQGSRSRTLEG